MTLSQEDKKKQQVKISSRQCTIENPSVTHLTTTPRDKETSMTPHTTKLETRLINFGRGETSPMNPWTQAQTKVEMKISKIDKRL